MTAIRRRRRHATSIGLRRFGLSNGRCKMSDDQVAWLRMLRIESLSTTEPYSYDDLAKKFGIHRKTVKYICIGLRRQTAGGPIERIQPRPMRKADECAPDPTMQFNRSVIIRCEGCRNRVHPSILNPKLCVICVRQFDSGACSHEFAS